MSVAFRLWRRPGCRGGGYCTTTRRSHSCPPIRLIGYLSAACFPLSSRFLRPVGSSNLFFSFTAVVDRPGAGLPFQFIYSILLRDRPLVINAVSFRSAVLRFLLATLHSFPPSASWHSSRRRCADRPDFPSDQCGAER